jgi:signal transduction histidine kinase/ActR/RegA family two-component response regulator
VFTSYTNIVDHCAHAWNRLVAEPWRIMSLGLRPWAPWVLITETWYKAQALAAALEQARTQKAKMDAIVASMPDGILVVDADLRLLEWNEHFPEFAGVPRDMLRAGLDLADVLRAQAAGREFGPVDVAAEVDRRIGLLRSGGSTGTIERKRPNGRVLELRRNLMSGGGFVTLYTDITERRQAEEQLRQAQVEAVGHLTGGMAHDFNNLLMVITGNLELALQALGRSDLIGADRRVRTAQGGTQRAAMLTERLLAFARRQPLAPQVVDANKIVSETSELVRHSIGAGIELETVLAGGLWEATIDPHQLENALINLAINARDAMPDAGKLTIETANTHLDASYAADHSEVTPGQYVMIAVSDSGTGMTPDEAERAFEPFFTTKGVGKGSGLGLSQVFGFVKQSRGHVKIYTELGAGTTVKLYVPRHVAARPEPSLFETATAEPDVPGARGQECILVVDDDEDVLAYTAEALELLGYHVIGARDASSALSAVDNHASVKLLLADVELPGLNGQELAQEVVRRHPEVAVLYMTGYTANAIVHREILEREARWLSKPFTLADLATTVRELLDIKALENALRNNGLH